MSRNIVLVMILFLIATHTTAASTDVVDSALRDIHPGSVADMRTRIFGFSFGVYEAKDWQTAITSIPQSKRENRIMEGKLLRRVENIIRPILELHGRHDKIELFLYRDSFPLASVWMGCVLVISDTLADSLHDDELAGIVAHEMAHAYFMIETIKARKNTDQLAMRIIELKCDAVAMLTLKLLGHNPADHLAGLRRITNLTRRNGYNRSINSRDYPSIGERAQFAQRFIKLLA